MTKTTPTYLLAERGTQWTMIARALRSSSGIWLFLDYDGTLTPIRSNPSQAFLPPATKRILSRLLAMPGIQVTIVTGRSMPTIRRFVRLTSIEYAANHGFHLRDAEGREWIHPHARDAVGMLKTAAGKLRVALEPFPQATVEDKVLTLSIHFRNCPPQQLPALRRAVRSTLRSMKSSLRTTRGKKVFEVRPGTQWGKREAVLALLERSRAAKHLLPVYIGDDITDEGAFEGLRSTGLTVRVGRSTTTKARYYVRDVGDVTRFLGLILSVKLKEAEHTK